MVVRDRAADQNTTTKRTRRRKACSSNLFGLCVSHLNWHRAHTAECQNSIIRFLMECFRAFLPFVSATDKCMWIHLNVYCAPTNENCFGATSMAWHRKNIFAITRMNHDTVGWILFSFLRESVVALFHTLRKNDEQTAYRSKQIKLGAVRFTHCDM